MNARKWQLIGAAAVALLPVFAAAQLVEGQPDAPTSAAAAPAPLPQEIKQLIDQLGHADYHTREAASKRLREVGEPALPALREAAVSANPEVLARAEALLTRIQRRPLPTGPLPGASRASTALHVVVNGGAKTIEAVDRGRRVRITEGPDGIDLSVTGTDAAGRPVTERYQAKTLDELREKNPDAAKLYETWASIGGELGMNGRLGGGRVIIRDGRVAPGRLLDAEQLELEIPVQRLPIRPMPIDPFGPLILPGGAGDDLQALRGRLLDDMRQARTDLAQQRRVLEQVERLMRTQLAGIGPDDFAERMEQYNRLSDELRQTLQDLKLPDPGEALPPPAKSRLGISLEQRLDGSIAVGNLLPGTRADKLGLKPGDVIQKVNGQAVASAKELRKVVTEAKEKLTVEVLRDGQVVKLQEQ